MNKEPNENVDNLDSHNLDESLTTEEREGVEFDNNSEIKPFIAIVGLSLIHI